MPHPAFHHARNNATARRTSSSVLIALLVTVLLSACIGSNAESAGVTPTAWPTPSPTVAAQPQSSVATPVVDATSADLQVRVAANAQSLIDMGNGVYSVELPAEGVGHPSMPTYTWYINGTESDHVANVVLEFDLIETVAPLDQHYFGYDRGYFVTLHNFETIPLTPSWWRGDTNYLGKYGDTNRAAMILMPELGVDLQKFVVTEANPNGTSHVRIVIPNSQFLTASKDLTLQFLPGTTFAKLVAYVQGDGVTQNTVDKITQTIDYNTFDHAGFIKEMLMNFNAQQSKVLSKNLIQDKDLNATCMGSMIERTRFNQTLYVNPDGSVNMHASFYDLGAYADALQGEYVVIPEGLIPAIFVLNQDNSAVRYSKEDKRKVINLALSMIDENGRFAGIYDISQGKIVATDRKVSALPIFSMMYNHLSDSQRDSIMNRIIANCIVRVGDTLYYAPNGLLEDGVMKLKLDDFALSGSFFEAMNKYSMKPKRLKMEFGCAKLMEAYANTLQLMLEAQEQNETRLPSSVVTVAFSQDGGYTLKPSDTFTMEGAYFSMGLASYEKFGQHLLEFAFENEGAFNTLLKKVARVKDGAYSDKQAQYIRNGAAMYAEFYNAYRIINTFYESWLDVYNFAKIQPVTTAYAPGYNVHTGEMISAKPGVFYSVFAWMKPFRKRFGTPAVSMNWFQLAGMFNDEEMMANTASLTMNQYDIYQSALLGSLNSNFANPDIYADNGLNVWGYDSLKYVTANGLTTTECTRYLFGTSGYSLNREDTDALIRRTLNQYRDAAHQLGPDDAIPYFYDSIPRADIQETAGN
jgi:hypothetical protein